MYAEFKRFAADSSLLRMERTRNLLANMLEYAKYYAAIKGVAAAGSGDMNVDAVSINSKTGQHGYGPVGYGHVRGMEA